MKHVLITGGSDGIGKVTAQKLKAAGFKVTILSRNEEKTRAAAAEIGCAYVVADVANYDEVEKAIGQAEEKAGQIDILINNAGIWLLGTLESNKPDEIHRAMEINALGTIYCTHTVMPAMKKRKGGRIINVISQGGLYGKAERGPYNASKWAITGFTKSMQDELKPFNVAVDGFYPGAMKTGIFAKAGDTKERPNALDLPVVAEALAYLCSLPDGVSAPEFGLTSLSY